MRLFELCGADRDIRFSPFVWRARLALAHKGLSAETVATRFTEKDLYAESGSRTVPVLEDGGHWVGDSWAIALYLEKTYPDRPSLFGGAAAQPMARFINRWCDMTVAGGLFPLIAVDVAALLDAENAAYFREVREARLGRSLEQAAAEREAARPAFQASLRPLAATVKDYPYLSGDAPGYPDYCLAATFAWADIVSPFDPLEGEPTLSAWRARLFGLYDGMIAKAPRAPGAGATP